MAKIGFALGSGAARGWSHIGVIEALEEAGITADLIAGTSIGSVVGAAYSAGRLQVVKQAALDLDWKKMVYYLFDIKRLRSGLIDGAKMLKYMGEHIPPTDIESLPIPFRCVATNAMSGEAVVLREGDLLAAIRASLSIPGIFTPVFREGQVLIDGGVVNPVPVDVARDMGADFVIAVDINSGRLRKAEESLPRNYVEEIKEAGGAAAEKSGLQWVAALCEKIEHFDPSRLGAVKEWVAPDPVPNIFDIIGNSIRIMEAAIAESHFRIHPADVLVRPEVGHIEVMEFNRADEVMEAGYRAGRAAIPEIHEKLDALNRGEPV